jgi:hypothetical protein
MLGLGPLVEGYSIVATKKHISSMLDLSETEVSQLSKFSGTLRDILRPHYGEVIITEHGRVPPCEQTTNSGMRTHCFHAHRLVFPIATDLTPALFRHGLAVSEYATFADCHKGFTCKGEYLYFERPDGVCMIAPAPRELVRQFFRYELAAQLGSPELASWTAYPRLEVLEAARRRLLPSEC